LSDRDVQLTDFGFTWGVAEVRRASAMPGGHLVIEIRTECGQSLDVYISPGGRSLRVFRRHRELKEVP